MTVVFIDYSAAFDSVSHKFIDKALIAAKVPNKERAMFRAMYEAAGAFATVSGTDGKKVKSRIFGIDRGVLQGDITSPLYFILALELILRIHDERDDKGVSLGHTMFHTLGYADDAALVDVGDASGVIRVEQRVNAIADGSSADADMDPIKTPRDFNPLRLVLKTKLLVNTSY